MGGLLVRVLTWFASGLLFRAITSLGIGIFSMFFINDILNGLIDAMRNALTGLPPAVIGILGIAGFDKYLSIVLGALIMVTYLKSMQFLITRNV